MKRVYSKPTIVFENFSLSTNIAAGCEYPTNIPHQFSCGVSFPPFVLFTADVAGCLPANGGVTLDTDEHNGYCYHNPTSQNNMFNS